MDKDLDIVMAHIGKMLMNKIKMGLTYDQWSNQFSYEEIIETYNRAKEHVKELTGKIDTLSFSELKQLGFSKWTEGNNLYLIPLWVYDFIEDGTELTCIDGKKVIKGKDDIDLDVRFGCIAYGMNIPSES